MTKGQDSLIAVTGSQHPYIFDLPHLLSLPDGFEFRFRWRSRWVSAELQKEVDSELGAKSLVGKRLLVIFHSQETKRLVPLRYCQVLSLERVGPLIFLRFRVGAFVALSPATVLGPNQEDEVKLESERLTKSGLSLFGTRAMDLSGSLPEGSYLFRTETCPADIKESDRSISQSWAAMAAVIMGEPHLEAIPLFHFLGFQKKDGTFLGASRLKGGFTVSKERIGGFELVEGSRYRARLLEWRDKPMPPYRVVCEVAPEAMRIEGKSDLVVGRYDVLEFSVKAQHRGYSELLLRVEPTNDVSPGEVGVKGAEVERTRESSTGMRWPTVYTARVPVLVRNSRPRLLALGASALVGFLLYSASASIAEGVLRWSASLLSLQAPSPGLASKALQVAGLALLFVAFGDLVERVLGVGEKIKGLSETGVKPSGK